MDNVSKKCSKCNEFKPTTEFHKKTSAKDGLKPDCKQCRKQYSQIRYQSNKEKILEKQKQYQQSHKHEILEYNKQYKQSHKPEIAEYKKQYKQSHKNERNEYERLKKQNDAQYRLICNLRSRLSNCIKNKSQSTKDLLGISFDIFIKWIKFQLPADYTIEDLGAKLHIDHVIPLSSFDLTDESQLKKAMSWVNLQPLESAKNQSKYNKINPWLSVLQEVKANYFIKHISK